MIKNLIFDFGDIFINLDKPGTARELTKFGFTEITPEYETVLHQYEKGLITDAVFTKRGIDLFPDATPKDFVNAWNAVILDFPEYRLQFIENLAKKDTYRLFLLSNTNAIHIEKVIESMGKERFNRFKNCFEKFYLSHEINLRKPDAKIYQFVLDDNNLNPTECFFIDDTQENTAAANKLGIKTWHLIVGKEDIIELNQKI